MPKKAKPKEVFKEIIKCPHCEKLLIVKKTKLQKKPSFPAEFEEKLIVEKDEQKTLG